MTNIEKAVTVEKSIKRFKHFVESRGIQIRTKEGEMSPTREEQEG